jgi:hypothetical protein
MPDGTSTPSGMTTTERPEEVMAGIARIRAKVTEERTNAEFVGLCSCFAAAYGVPEEGLLVPGRVVRRDSPLSARECGLNLNRSRWPAR